MNYELAKQLKDAGYPQDAAQHAVWKHPAMTGYENEEWAATPTLSELIEACGNRFEALRRCEDGVFCADTAIEGRLVTPGQGDTPEEAVARLWLALNRHAA
jgi:hypothetical protein